MYIQRFRMYIQRHILNRYKWIYTIPTNIHEDWRSDSNTKFSNIKHVYSWISFHMYIQGSNFIEAQNE